MVALDVPPNSVETDGAPETQPTQTVAPDAEALRGNNTDGADANPPAASTIRLRHPAPTSPVAAGSAEFLSPTTDPLSPTTLVKVPDMNSLLFVVPWLQQNALPMAQQLGPMLEAAWPHLEAAATLLKAGCNLVPMELVPAIFGLIMVFFGGHYLTTIAAAEAFRMVGWRTIRDSLRILHLNYRKARLGLRRDRLQRMNSGTLGTEQEFLEKIRIVLRSVDPERLSSSLSSLWAGILAAIATVRYRYAQTITLGASIGEILEEYGGPFLRPVLTAIVPPEYQKWCPVILNYGSKWIGVCIAWSLQRVVSALQSSLRGAKMMTDSVRQYLIAQQFIPQDASPLTFQVISMGVAVLGFSWQLATSFTLPFPLNVFCLPFAVLEWFLTTVVNFAPATIPGAMPVPPAL